MKRVVRLPAVSRVVSAQDEALMLSLAKLGYEAALPPRPLFRKAAHDVLGVYPAQLATPSRPIDLGKAEIVASGATHGSLVVVRIPGRGDYWAGVLHDLFFAGQPVPCIGRLYYAQQFYVFCADDCSLDEITKVAARVALPEG